MAEIVAAPLHNNETLRGAPEHNSRGVVQRYRLMGLQPGEFDSAFH